VVECGSLESCCPGFRGYLDRGFESPSLRHDKNNLHKLPYIGLSKLIKQPVKPLYDTFPKNYDTAMPLRLYKVGEVFYYRRKYQGKLFRISLRTKTFRVALYRKRLLDLLKGEELFKLKQGDYELIFEYDTIDELKEVLEATKATQEQINSATQQYTTVHDTLEKGANKIPDSRGLKFNDLEIKFIEAKRKSGKVGKSTYKAYSSTFKKLYEFFKRKSIDTLSIEDYEDFREYLAKHYKLKNKTINNHMAYVNTFLEFGVNRQLLKFNPVKALESLSVEVSKKENYTDEEIQKILTYEFPEPHKTFFEIAIYSGMRLHEIHNLSKENIKHDDTTGVYYFDIIKSKTTSGIRKVPIHKNILDKVLKTEFPLFKDKTTDATQKVMNRQLSKVIDKNSTKTFHTFRATFIEKAVNAYPEKIVTIQEIVGHSKSDKDKLTLDTYAKGFSLSLKKEVVDSVCYQD